MGYPCHYDNTAVANRIADLGDTTADNLRNDVDALRKAYFDLADKVASHAYCPAAGQLIDMRRLGQLAELIAKLDAARSAANACRCWLS